MSPHLFVYGSLMSTAGHVMGARLGSEARLLGPATIRARLYRISWYPGAVPSDDPADRVHGELYALADPARSLAWLDDYEGIAPGSRESGEYERVEGAVTLHTGGELRAWVYLYRKPVDPAHLVADGRWRSDAR